MITDEIVDDVSELPRGACTGTLKPNSTSIQTSSAASYRSIVHATFSVFQMYLCLKLM